MRRTIIGIAAAIAAIGIAAPATATEPAYVTLAFGRSQWVSSANCVRVAGTIDLGQVADELTLRGLTGVGNVVIGRTNATTRRCVNHDVLSASWADLASLRDDHGWRFVSASATYANMTTLTPTEQYAESCGSLDALYAHGHTSAWGMFAYPNNRYTDTIQADVVSTCFAYGRTYARYTPNVRTSMAAPWFQTTHTLSGGACNVIGAACYPTTNVAGHTRYQSPATVASFLGDTGPGTWAVLQAYRFVTGAGSGGRWAWDCTSANWRDHWTSAVELYCWDDYRAIIDGIPVGAIVTDPATVATAWGRVP